MALEACGRWGRLLAKLDPPGMAVGGRIALGAGNMPPALRTPAFAWRGLRSIIEHRPRWVVSTHAHFAPAARLARHLMNGCITVAHGVEIHPELSAARRHALAESSAIWAVSRWTRQRCIDLGLPGQAITVIGNTVDDLRFRTGGPSPDLQARYGITPGERVVLTVARLDPGERYKGYDRVIRALPALRARVGDVRYLLVGGGADGARAVALAQSLGVADRLTLCGFVPDGELADHYRLADVFAMPSLGEGFGIVFLEAMACGIPVLGGDRDGTRDALDDGRLGRLVDPEDVEAIATGIAHLLEYPSAGAPGKGERLREACLAKHGRPVFAVRIGEALARLEGGC